MATAPFDSLRLSLTQIAKNFSRHTAQQNWERFLLSRPHADDAKEPFQHLKDRRQFFMELVTGFYNRRRLWAGLPAEEDLHTLLQESMPQMVVVRPFPPMPSLEEFGDYGYLAHALVQMFGSFALDMTPVRDYLHWLEEMIEDERIPKEVREQLLTFWDDFFGLMRPSLAVSGYRSDTLYAMALRAPLLEIYEAELKKLQKIYKKWQNRAPRQVALREAYPDIPPGEIKAWASLQPWKIASSLAGRAFGLTFKSAQQVIKDARRDRKRLRALDNPSEPSA